MYTYRLGKETASGDRMITLQRVDEFASDVPLGPKVAVSERLLAAGAEIVINPAAGRFEVQAGRLPIILR